jgi:hypothetical protein
MSDSRKVRSAGEVLAAAGVKKGRKGGKRSKSKDTRPAHQRYKAEHHKAKNKVRRILKSNGVAAARMYAAAHAITQYVEEVMKDAGA